ncbi:hypothetical protein ADL35_05495, partial [Streptomyces sp. NRRL WC-3753]
MLNVAIPSLTRELDASTADVQWMINAYSLVQSGLLLTAGSSADRYGRKKMLLVGLGLFGDAPDGFGEAFAADGLEDVVDGLEVEGVDGEALVGGDEDDERRARESGQQAGHVESGEPGHLDVEEEHVDGLVALRARLH